MCHLNYPIYKHFKKECDTFSCCLSPNWKTKPNKSFCTFVLHPLKILCQNSARKTAKMTNNKGETAKNYSQRAKKKNQKQNHVYIIACAWGCVFTPFPSPFPSHFLTINVPFIADWQTAPLWINKRINNQKKKTSVLFFHHKVYLRARFHNLRN